MQLAADPITVEIAGEVIELRPTLRAATRLSRRYGDLATLYEAILADHVTPAHDVIHEGSGSRESAADFLSAASFPGLRSTLAPLKLPMLRFVLALAGHDPAATPAPATSDKQITFDEYCRQLFAIGTGWLGWSPEETWEATPAEILAAQSGRTDMIGQILKSVFSEPVKATAPIDLDPQFDRAAFNSLKAKIKANVR